MHERDVIQTDVLIIGAGPAGLATAIHLADLINAYNQKIDSGVLKGEKLPLNIMVLEKGSAVGSHSISGAVVNPVTLKKLLPDLQEKDMPFESPVTRDEAWFLGPNFSVKLPFHPPYMSNHGNYVTVLGKMTRWMGDIAEKKGAQIYSGFSGYDLIYDKDRVVGVQTGDSGIDKHGHKEPNYVAGAVVKAKVTILAEGSRGHMAKQLIAKLDLQKDKNPQVYSVGVKELWEVPEGTFEKGRVVHTLGYPLGFDQFGGGFIYGVSATQVALGLVTALDWHDPTFDEQHAFQVYKQHPFVRRILEKGKMIRYGAKSLPEGGLYSMPKLYHDGVMLVGDSAGFLSMPSLKGIHLGMESGMLAAQAAFEALKVNDTSARQLALYDELFRKSDAYKDLYPVRNFRQGFGMNLLFGAIHFAFQLVTGGRGLSLSGRLKAEEDCKRMRPLSKMGKGFMARYKDKLNFDKKLTFDKATDVFFSGTQHDEHQPSHCKVLDLNVCHEKCLPVYGGPCQYFCPAEVYEIVTDPKTGKKDLRLHPTNCVHCKTCDIKDPFNNLQWTPPYGGDGPEFDGM
mgnify:CR=1 FL=1